jgi:histone-lysine N-methyltransferase SETMAR
MYIDVLRHLGDAARRKRPEKWRTTGWFLIHENAPGHRSVLILGFLAKNKVTTLDYCPHSPDLAPADFYLFPRLKSVLNGRCFCDAADIIKNATEE